MKNLFVFLFACATISFFSCTNGNKSEMAKKIDSLEQVNASYQKDMNELNAFITALADGLDSIALHEEILFSNKGKEGIYVNREQLMENLEVFEDMLIQQKQRIKQMDDSLKSEGIKTGKLNTLVNHLIQQLDAKNNEIQILKEGLGKGKLTISQLQGRVSSLSKNNKELTNKVEKQMEDLAVQDEMLNEGYVKIGTKKELTNGGFISGGFLKKTKINYSNFSKSNFMSVDIRTFKEITLKSKSPKILSQMPASTYKFIKGDKGVTILQILDPTAFWSVSRYLIIQMD